MKIYLRILFQIASLFRYIRSKFLQELDVTNVMTISVMTKTTNLTATVVFQRSSDIVTAVKIWIFYEVI